MGLTGCTDFNPALNEPMCMYGPAPIIQESTSINNSSSSSEFLPNENIAFPEYGVMEPSPEVEYPIFIPDENIMMEDYGVIIPDKKDYPYEPEQDIVIAMYGVFEAYPEVNEIDEDEEIFETPEFIEDENIAVDLYGVFIAPEDEFEETENVIVPVYGVQIAPDDEIKVEENMPVYMYGTVEAPSIEIDENNKE